MLFGGCWIFLSHSSHDIEKVRMVRNEFERLGHNPLAFHLKCLSTATEEGRRELDSLIKREIDAREWFVFCESPDAAKSPYVKQEQDYILKSGKDKVWKIDMTADNDTILNQVRKISEDLEVFISYSHKDHLLIQPLVDEFVKKDYSVFYDDNFIKPGESFAESIESKITRCSRNGFHIIVITKASLESQYVQKEVSFAREQGAWIVPIVVGDVELPQKLAFMLGATRINRVPEKPTKKDFSHVVDQIDEAVKKRMSEGLFAREQ